jgi:type IV pilus assembly protein PilX
MNPRALIHVKQQRGVALVIVLVLLVIVTMLALTSMRGTGMQEHMSANLYDRSLVFQAAESAVREAESLLPPTSAAPAFQTCGYWNPTIPTVKTGSTTTSCRDQCTNGLCSAPHPNDKPRWEDDGFAGWRTATSALGTLAGPAPQFIIEDMGMGENWPKCSQVKDKIDTTCLSPRWRITVRVVGDAVGRAAVVLQSSYR